MKRKLNKKNANGSAWPVAYRWAAMGTLVMYTAVGTRTVALAQTASPAPKPEAQGQSLTVRRFDIPAGALDTVLAAFQEATQLKVNLANEAIRNINSPGVS